MFPKNPALLLSISFSVRKYYAYIHEKTEKLTNEANELVGRSSDNDSVGEVKKNKLPLYIFTIIYIVCVKKVEFFEL